MWNKQFWVIDIKLLEKIGDGGMAFVYQAKDKLLNRIVAVKVLRPEFVDDKDF